jgi:HEAT repeat protein
VKLACAIGLGQRGDNRGLDTLVSAFATGSDRLRIYSLSLELAAVDTLGVLKNNGGVDALVSAMGRPYLRAEAIRSLGKLGSPDALAALLSVVGNDSGAGRGEATVALARAGWNEEPEFWERLQRENPRLARIAKDQWMQDLSSQAKA